MHFALQDLIYFVAIEVDGPFHYIFPEKRLNLETQAKRRYLQRKGWSVINIDNTSKDNAHQVGYLGGFGGFIWVSILMCILI